MRLVAFQTSFLKPLTASIVHLSYLGEQCEASMLNRSCKVGLSNSTLLWSIQSSEVSRSCVVDTQCSVPSLDNKRLRIDIDKHFANHLQAMRELSMYDAPTHSIAAYCVAATPTRDHDGRLLTVLYLLCPEFLLGSIGNSRPSQRSTTPMMITQPHKRHKNQTEKNRYYN